LASTFIRRLIGSLSVTCKAKKLRKHFFSDADSTLKRIKGKPSLASFGGEEDLVRGLVAENLAGARV
jgi:hypothetical protein